MKFNVIGAGRLGAQIARSFIESGVGELQSVCNQRLQSSQKAVIDIGFGVAVASVDQLLDADLFVIATPDDVIASVAMELAKYPTRLSGKLVIHCSGVLLASVLKPLAALNCRLASAHPLKAFSKGPLKSDAFKGCDCILEGNPMALVQLIDYFKQTGAHVLAIDAEKKAVYHAAAVMASNYVVTLAQNALDLFFDAGIPIQKAKQMTERLMHSSLSNLQDSSEFKNALTGPLARGDVNTIAQHLGAIEREDLKSLYQSLALATLPLTNLDEKSQTLIQQLLVNVP